MTTTPADIMVPEVEKVCELCGVAFYVWERLARYAKKCGDCMERESKEETDKIIRSVPQVNEGYWKQICPETFRDSTPERLPYPGKLKRVMEWQHGPKGLLLHGPTGSGKSRCLYLLLRREFLKRRGIVLMNHSTAYDYATAYENGPGCAQEWIERRCEVSILAMDDIFKSKLTDSFEQAVFTIISQRTERARPILLTTNDVGTSLESRMSADRGPALVRRLREFCETISFK